MKKLNNPAFVSNFQKLDIEGLVSYCLFRILSLDEPSPARWDQETTEKDLPNSCGEPEASGLVIVGGCHVLAVTTCAGKPGVK